GRRRLLGSQRRAEDREGLGQVLAGRTIDPGPIREEASDQDRQCGRDHDGFGDALLVLGDVADRLADGLGQLVALHVPAADLLGHAPWAFKNGALSPTTLPPSTAAILGRMADEIRITGEPSRSGDRCAFIVDRPVFAGESAHFAAPDAARYSPLAGDLLQIAGVDSVLIADNTVTVSAAYPVDWPALGIGNVIRKHLRSA